MPSLRGARWEFPVKLLTAPQPMRRARLALVAGAVFAVGLLSGLLPAFRHWSIEAEIGAINCPLLAVQGLDDEYGTLAQIRGIARRLPQTRLLELPDCGHSPHKDQPGAVIAATRALLANAGL